MSYVALYRKFRPHNFDDVKGQEHIVTTLKNQINADRVGHAYLFCGTRGTGKTSVAKILAKTVNCEQPLDGNPCNTCDMCSQINTQSSMNVIEIDAASNNGVDNVREIIDEVRYSPPQGRYKVYIIDEVHMLSAGAFNALLKTLEEPPSYVIFILATTEVHKIPITILSRCQRYDFRRITIDRIQSRLSQLMDVEGIDVEEKALRYVAKLADGSMRDALSLLDQCIAFYLGQKLTYDNVIEVLGTVEVETFAKLLRMIRKSSVEECIEILDSVITSGGELTQFTVDFTWYLRNLLLVKTSENPNDLLEASSDHLELLHHEADVCESELLIRYIQILSDLTNQIRYAAQKRILIEIALIKLCKPMMETDLSSLINRIKILEEHAEQGIPLLVKPAAVEAKPKEIPIAVPLKAVSADLKEIATQWKQIILKTSPMVRTILLQVVPSPGTGDRLMLVFANEIDKAAVDKEERLAEIRAAVVSVTGKEVVIETKLANGMGESIHDFPDLTRLINSQLPIEYVD